MRERTSDTIDQAFKAPPNLTNYGFVQRMLDRNQRWQSYRRRATGFKGQVTEL